MGAFYVVGFIMAVVLGVPTAKAKGAGVGIVFGAVIFILFVAAGAATTAAS